MQKLFLILLIVFAIIGCSSEKSTNSTHNEKTPSVAQKQTTQAVTPDTSNGKLKNGNGDPSPDNLIENELTMQRLELARQHYLLALAAQAAGDSVGCGAEFENSIQILNELSEYSTIDTSKDYIELSKSVIEDYEKYIAEIDSLGPDASVYALREKLNQVVDQGDTTGMNIPRIEMQNTQVPLPLNQYSERAVGFFMGRGRPHIERWLYLSGRYCPLMKRIFREEGVPEELVFLSMTESGLRTDARSWARAVGLWQFMKGTGSLYGLRVNWWIDERRDFEKSTRAAARHLKDLYRELNDWNLVLGAYNAGAGRIFRGIRRSGSTDYWEMRRYLPRQTRNYVPQYIAVTRIMLNLDKHGFTDIEIADSLAYDVVEIGDCVDLRILAKCALTTVDTVQALNPELLRWCTPPGVSGYRLRVPAGRKDTFEVNYSKIPSSQKKDWAIHTVRRGETISTVARRYGLTVELLKDVNNIRHVRRLSIGTVLAIPLPRDVADNKVPFDYSPGVKGINFGSVKSYIARNDVSRTKLKKAKREMQKPKDKEKLIYRVKRGDTIGHIAEWYSVRASDIRNWNDIEYGSYIHAGQELAVWVPASKTKVLKKIDAMEFSAKQALTKSDIKEEINTGEGNTRTSSSSNEWIQHTVKSGESLEKIARTYDVSINDLKRWNNLRNSKIVIGQELDIYDKPEERVKVIDVSIHKNDTPSVKTSGSGIFSATHVVKRGESLYVIARKYGVDQRKLKNYNKLSRNSVFTGQVLKIPPKEID